jgi:hypothetical protein
MKRCAVAYLTYLLTGLIILAQIGLAYAVDIEFETSSKQKISHARSRLSTAHWQFQKEEVPTSQKRLPLHKTPQRQKALSLVDVMDHLQNRHSVVLRLNPSTWTLLTRRKIAPPARGDDPFAQS